MISIISSFIQLILYFFWFSIGRHRTILFCANFRGGQPHLFGQKGTNFWRRNHFNWVALGICWRFSCELYAKHLHYNELTRCLDAESACVIIRSFVDCSFDMRENRQWYRRTPLPSSFVPSRFIVSVIRFCWFLLIVPCQLYFIRCSGYIFFSRQLLEYYQCGDN